MMRTFKASNPDPSVALNEALGACIKCNDEGGALVSIHIEFATGIIRIETDEGEPVVAS